MNWDSRKYKVYTWKNWMVLHWIFNPGLAINELIFGQRVPKLSLEDLESDKPRYERSYVPCPHCNTLHDARTWTPNNGLAFKNWFGLYCTSCGKIIPCVLNVWSFIILLLSSPLWIWFARPLKARWLKQQPQRYAHAQVDMRNPFDGKNWLSSALAWGGFMFLLMGIIIPVFQGEVLDTKNLAVSLLLWALAGLAFGYTMKLFLGRRNQEKRHGSF